MPPGLHEALDAMLAADDREGVLVAACREVARLAEEEIEHLRAQPAWPNRLAAAHTVSRALRLPAERMFDTERAAGAEVPALVLVGSETPPRSGRAPRGWRRRCRMPSWP